MKVRYHIVPREIKGEKKLFLVETKNKTVQIQNPVGPLSELERLQSKLENWYKEKNINFEATPLENMGYCYAYNMADVNAGDPIMQEYYHSGGCGVGELIEEIEARKLEQTSQYLDEDNWHGLMDSEGLEDSYNFIEENVDDEWHDTLSASSGFSPLGEESSNLSFFDNTPIECNYMPQKPKASSSLGDERKRYSSGKRRRKDTTDEGMILGHQFTGTPININDLGDGGKGLIFEGKITGLEIREFKPKQKNDDKKAEDIPNKAILTGNVVDKTNSIRFSKFMDDVNEANDLLKKLKGLKGALVRGDVEYDDRYERDYAMKIYDIKEVDHSIKRTENREDSRVELHLHTKMSDKDALVTVKELLQTVKAWGHPAVAITDHGVVQAFPEAQDIAGKLGIKVIYGVEGYLITDEESDKRYHIILLAQNLVGLRNLYKLVTISHLQYYKRRPRLPREVIEEHREGLIIGSACEAGELMQAIVRGESKEELLKIASFYDYLEIQPICNNEFLLRKGLVPDRETLIQMNKTIVELGDSLGKPVVATCDVHYLNPEDKIYREIMLTACGFPDAADSPDLHLRTTDEMLEEFQYLGEEKAYEVVVTNSRMINDSIEAINPVPNGTYSPKIEGAEQELSDMCYKKAKEIYGDPLPSEVQERLDYELNNIIGHGFAVLYFIAHKLVKNSLDNGYLVGSRGSVGSSFVATMADITEVNPLPPHYICPKCKYSEFFTNGEYAGGFDLPRKNCPHCGTPLGMNGHDIPFAVFMGFNGDKVPDIDLNFSGDYQAKAHKYTEELFGRDNVFKAGTIGTIAEKTAVGYVRKYAEIRGIQARRGFLEDLAVGFTKVKNTTGQHPGGIMVCPRDMDVHQFTPVQYPANKKDSGVITTHFDYHSIEGRMTKLDILGHDDPTIIRMLEDITGIDVKTIPFDDPATLSLFNSTESIGLTPEQLNGDKVASLAVPECGTSFVRQMLEDSKPQKFSDIVRISGFSHGTNVWLDNAQTLIKNGTCQLNEAISTRDDIMNYLRNHGMPGIVGFKVMENVRKGKGIDKKDKLGNPETEYEKQMRDGGIPEWFIDSCKKISYLFPRAHAVAYVMMAFRIAWFKINQPLAFYAAYFSIRSKAYDIKLMMSPLEDQKQEFDRLMALKKDHKASPLEENMITALEVSMEMVQRGYHFGNVSLENSQARRFCIVNGELVPPFLMVDSLGEKVADAMVEEREKRMFTSIKDMQRRAKVSQSIVETMRELGALDDLPEDEQMDLFAM